MWIFPMFIIARNTLFVVIAGILMIEYPNVWYIIEVASLNTSIKATQIYLLATS